MKFTRTQVVQEIQIQIQNRGNPVTQVVNIEDIPQQLRHACMPLGVSFLSVQIFQVPTEDMGVVPFNYFYCDKCGKLYVSKHLYD